MTQRRVDLRWWTAIVAAPISIAWSAVVLADSPSDRYEIQADTVKDLKTGLTWQRNEDCNLYNWNDAKNYCQGLGPGWRLPALKELLTLVDRTRVKPAIDVNAFPDSSIAYWTASPNLGEWNTAPEAWIVDFTDGRAEGNPQDYRVAVRCLR